MKWSLGKKLAVGFGTLIVLIIGIATVVFVKVNAVNKVQNRVIELRQPTAMAGKDMLNGINHSLAALRGYMILGKDKFKNERTIAWTQEIEPSVDKMKQFSVNWTDPKNIERLNTIESNLADFKKYQQEIEDIALKLDNTPAMKILFKEAAPQAKILAENITKMIDVEAEQGATPERKALLGMMADTRGTLGLGLGAIRAYLLSGDESFKKQYEKLWAKNTRRFGDLSAQVDLLTPEQREAYDQFFKARKLFDPLPAKMFQIRGGQEWNLANTWLRTKAAPKAFAIKENLDAMVQSQQSLMQADVNALATDSKALVNIVLGVAGIGLVLGIVIAWRNIVSITKPIKQIIAGLSDGAYQVTSASGQLSSASQSLAEGSIEQAAGLEETSSSLEEMSSMTKTNADNAQQANTISDEASQAANTGNQAMSRMSDAINDIQKSSEETAKIIKTIDEIAFQTNLLALNAAVEAARAGEAGKGFAVVAEEVRNLAMRSAEAAKSTSTLIEESVKNAQNGVDISGEVAQSLEEIVVGISKTTDLVSEIAAASQEQAQGIDQVNTAMTQMDKVTQQNAANAEESASASEELSAQAEQMNQIVNELATLIDGNNTQSTSLTGGSSSPSGSLSQSDNTFHDIASTKKTPAQESIPMGSDSDFDEFNL